MAGQEAGHEADKNQDHQVVKNHFEPLLCVKSDNDTVGYWPRSQVSSLPLDGSCQLGLAQTRSPTHPERPRSLVELPPGVAENVDAAERLSLAAAGGRAPLRGPGVGWATAVLGLPAVPDLFERVLHGRVCGAMGP